MTLVYPFALTLGEAFGVSLDVYSVPPMNYKKISLDREKKRESAMHVSTHASECVCVCVCVVSTAGYRGDDLHHLHECVWLPPPRRVLPGTN